MIRLIIVTIVLVVIAVVLRVRGGGSAKVRSIRVTARTSLHRGAVLAVVEVEGRRLLVGAGAQQVTVLAELDPAPPVEPAPLEPVPAGHSTTLLERIRRATSRSADPNARALVQRRVAR